jgi:uncharacterized protein (TIGR00730 family)
MKQKNTLPISRAQIEDLLKEYSREHHVSADKIYSIISDFIMGFEFLSELHQSKKAVSIFGTARCNHESTDYNQATKLANLLAKDGFAIVTGGGPGVMEAANKGALEAGGRSVGLNIILKSNQKVNPYVTESKSFAHFYVRKTMLEFASQIYIFFPGGFGTLDEFFEMVMLIQTQKIPALPIILVGRSYWEPLLSWIEKSVYASHYVEQKDLQIYHLVDNADQAHQLIKKLIM